TIRGPLDVATIRGSPRRMLYASHCRNSSEESTGARRMEDRVHGVSNGSLIYTSQSASAQKREHDHIVQIRAGRFIPLLFAGVTLRVAMVSGKKCQQSFGINVDIHAVFGTSRPFV